jgi:diguanylate cyclase (GGDEF)-like protein
MRGSHASTEAGSGGVAKTGTERRGATDRRQGRDRRVEAEAVQSERRIGFDRRTLRERRSGLGRERPASTTEAGSPGLELFAPRLRQLAHLDLSEAEAERHWGAIARHRRNLLDRLGRDVGDEVAALDYFLSINPRLTRPTVIESEALAAVERDAMTDGLTGLFNRRYLEAGLEREVRRFRRYGTTVSLILFDLDGFKNANDRYGHPVGDRALREVAGLVSRHLRAADIACRYGGDEFAVVLPDADGGNTWLAAERIRVDIGSHFVERQIAGCTLGLTVSAGLATIGEGCGTAESMLRLADRRLYGAKVAGGDRVAPG